MKRKSFVDNLSSSLLSLSMGCNQQNRIIQNKHRWFFLFLFLSHPSFLSPFPPSFPLLFSSWRLSPLWHNRWQGFPCSRLSNNTTLYSHVSHIIRHPMVSVAGVGIRDGLRLVHFSCMIQIPNIAKEILRLENSWKRTVWGIFGFLIPGQQNTLNVHPRLQ